MPSRKRPTLRYSGAALRCVPCHTAHARSYRLVQLHTGTPHFWVVCQDCEPEWNQRAGQRAMRLLERYEQEQRDQLAEVGELAGAKPVQ